MVDLVVDEPCGAWPTGCAGLYPADEAHLARYLDLAERSREREYLDTTVRAPRRQAELARAAAQEVA
jgi:glutaconate CoA-transferase subunit A